jgi:sugar phosphate isomerase/epimerase
MAKDPQGTLEQVAKTGFNSIECAGYAKEKFYGMDAKQFSALLKNTGLIMPSAHYRLGLEKEKDGTDTQGTIMHDWQRAVDDAAAVGVKYMVCAWLSQTERGGIDHYKEMAGQFNTAAETCKKAGIQFCYHNHDFEFVEQNGPVAV